MFKKTIIVILVLMLIPLSALASQVPTSNESVVPDQPKDMKIQPGVRLETVPAAKIPERGPQLSGESLGVPIRCHIQPGGNNVYKLLDTDSTGSMILYRNTSDEIVAMNTSNSAEYIIPDAQDDAKMDDLGQVAFVPVSDNRIKIWYGPNQQIGNGAADFCSPLGHDCYDVSPDGRYVAQLKFPELAAKIYSTSAAAAPTEIPFCNPYNNDEIEVHASSQITFFNNSDPNVTNKNVILYAQLLRPTMVFQTDNVTAGIFKMNENNCLARILAPPGPTLVGFPADPLRGLSGSNNHFVFVKMDTQNNTIVRTVYLYSASENFPPLGPGPNPVSTQIAEEHAIGTVERPWDLPFINGDYVIFTEVGSLAPYGITDEDKYREAEENRRLSIIVHDISGTNPPYNLLSKFNSDQPLVSVSDPLITQDGTRAFFMGRTSDNQFNLYYCILN